MKVYKKFNHVIALRSLFNIRSEDGIDKLRAAFLTFLITTSNLILKLLLPVKYPSKA